MRSVGFRGYIGSRPYDGERVPQHVQNLVIRDYARRNNMQYLLSMTEYCMPGCYMMLSDAIDGLANCQGIILYSLRMLPSSSAERRKIYTRVLDEGAQLHAAVEDISIKSLDDVSGVEDILAVHHAVARSDVGGPLKALKAGAW